LTSPTCQQCLLSVYFIQIDSFGTWIMGLNFNLTYYARILNDDAKQTRLPFCEAHD